MSRTQSTRQADLITPLGPDELLFHQMVAHEGMSQLFEYDLVVLSDDENIVLSDLVGQHSHVELELPNDATRFFCGHVTRFSFLGYQGNLAKYMVKLRPWLWFLTQAQNNRIYQNQTVPQIIESVCSDHGFTDIDNRLQDTYDQREFCVQYRESDFDFVSRLLEEEGIYYYFVHEAGKHELVLHDIGPHTSFGDYALVPWYPPDSHDHRVRDHIDHWELCQSVRSGQYAMRDFNFEKPQNKLEAKGKVDRPIEHGSFEVYDYPGGYGEVTPGEKYARKRIEALQASFEVMNGSGNARGMQPGHLFTLEDHDRNDQNREYLILSVTHDVTQDDYDSTADASSDSFNYGCTLQAIPSSEQFRPPLVTPRPIVHGPQTAVVVGDSSKGNISTDEFGRVRVEFHWDRRDLGNLNSSCMVRVSQAWAGNGWGAQFLPRIGDEVIVEFLEGDPDRPIITGAVYNARNRPPYDPGNETSKRHSGIKTRSVPDGGTGESNEIRFEDNQGYEKLVFHAEKDMDITVENNETAEILGNRTHTVDKDDTRNVKGNDAQTIDGRQNIEVKKDRDVTVRRSVTETVSVHQTEIIGGVWANTSHGGININSPTAPITVTAGPSITLTATDVKLLDSNRYDANAYSLSFTGSANAIEGQHLDVRAISFGLIGVNIGANGVNMGKNGVDITSNGVELKRTGARFSNDGIQKNGSGLTLDTDGAKLKKAGFHLAKAALGIFG
jgi:type VI secretion system secreted protein VgrG